jgi:hypothetical protein
MSEPAAQTGGADDLVRTAHVPTARSARYAKQLAEHLGHRSQIRETPDGIVIELSIGSCLLTTGDDELTLTARAKTTEDLAVVSDVVARHLVRFGQRDELVVEWEPA